jgi:penicillin-insensitive murein endopeptidase
VPDGSRSVGDTSNGYLVGAKKLEETERLAVLPKQRERGLSFGSDQLLAMLDEAGAKLQDATGTKLWLGNLARRYGGDIPWSVSHNSGRDADIAFAYRDANGHPADPPDLVPLDSAGYSARTGLRFDVARTWLIVRTLLESHVAEVQYLFISAPLKNLLLVHATLAGESPTLLTKAAEVLRQPGGSGAHDDHLHLRLYCSERDVLAGCIDAGIAHPWHRGHDDARQRRILELEAFLRDPAPSRRRRAIDRLVLLDARGTLEAMAHAVSDEDPGVRRAAIDALGAFGSARHATMLEAHWREERDPLVRIAILRAASRLGGEAAGQLLATAVGSPERAPSELDQAVAAWRAFVLPPPLAVAPSLFSANLRYQEAAPFAALVAPSLPMDDDWLPAMTEAAALATALQLSAIDAAAQSERLEPLAALRALLRSPDDNVRRAADRALAFTTNQSAGFADAPSDPARVARSIERWEALLAKNASTRREAWLVSGFKAAGYDVRDLHARHAWELVRATAGHDAVSFNAQRSLMRIFDHHPPSLAWSKGDACTHWLRWLEGERSRHWLSAPSATLRQACANVPG